MRRVRDALERNAYCPFFDEDPECLPKGEFFSPQIKTACELTDVAVLVLSDEFFTSKWPMIELSIFIREQMRREGMKILPLFMKVSRLRSFEIQRGRNISSAGSEKQYVPLALEVLGSSFVFLCSVTLR